ncbi:hypothetical protein BGAL_1089g00010 [Botrytis galanthina]|uniref:Uncharacterized protein n=1 Tax=Botrytis galanthina TaxID=278940 RepID=A0A4S8QG98_9HELO|nr:hypothetical protein BGAL_1089g00010 [Botrytis galanthina]
MADALQARQEVMAEALEIIAEKQDEILVLLQKSLGEKAVGVTFSKSSTNRTASSQFKRSGMDVSMSEDDNDRLLFYSTEWINTGAGSFLKTKRKNNREWSLKWRDYLMATFEEAYDNENSLKELLESWDEEKVAQAYMGISRVYHQAKDGGNGDQDAFGKSNEDRNVQVGKRKRMEASVEEEEQGETGDRSKKRMDRISRRKIIIEDESEEEVKDEADVDLEDSTLLD